MKFKELREATLTKTQIKKVHDKADDLPKNDFIKRYGKEGDSVRFATATKMVKKELGIEDYEEGFKSDAQRKAAFASGYKEKGKNKKEELDDKDKETIKPIIKQLQKSVKAHDKQAKQLQKDIQDEVETKDEMFSTRSLGLKGASKRSRDKAREKDKDSEKSKKKEEVEITEAVSDAYVKQIARMTDNNDHFGARFELARIMKDKQLMGFYDSLEKMHTTLPRGVIGNDAINIRQRLERLLRDRLKYNANTKADADKLIDAL